MVTVDDCCFEVPELQHDRQALREIARQLSHLWEPFIDKSGKTLHYDRLRYPHLFKDFPLIDNMAKAINIRSYAVMCGFYRFPPNYHLLPHVDIGERQCVFQFPLWDKVDEGAPIRFGNIDHIYAVTHATVINTQREHEVFVGSNPRLTFQIGVFTETYESVYAKQNIGNLIRPGF